VTSSAVRVLASTAGLESPEQPFSLLAPSLLPHFPIHPVSSGTTIGHFTGERAREPRLLHRMVRSQVKHEPLSLKKRLLRLLYQIFFAESMKLVCPT
jgi:hypothetical protein